MIKYVAGAVAVAVAGVPAGLGLVGNASFTRDVDVRVPMQASAAASAGPEDGRHRSPRRHHAHRSHAHGALEPGDDRGGREAEPGDDRGGREAEPGDDRGGDDGGHRHGSRHGGSGDSRDD